MSDFLREVDEDYRRDQLVKLWKTFGPWVIGAAVATVLAVAGTKFWTAHVSEGRQARAELYAEALDHLNAGRVTEAYANFSELNDGSGEGYGILGKFAQAKSHILAGEVPQAVSLYEALSIDSDVPKTMQDLAVVLKAMALLETQSAQQTQESLALVAQESGPWSSMASEIIGMAFLRENRIDEARDILGLLAIDPTASPGVQARTRNILTLLGPAPEEVNSKTEDAAEDADNG